MSFVSGAALLSFLEAESSSSSESLNTTSYSTPYHYTCI